MTRGDGGLERIRPQGVSEFFDVVQGGETAMDKELIPARTVLIQEQDRLPRGTNSRA